MQNYSDAPLLTLYAKQITTHLVDQDYIYFMESATPPSVYYNTSMTIAV